MLRKTCKLAHVVDTRRHLDETAGELGRKQEALRKTGSVGQIETAGPVIADFHQQLGQIQNLIAQTDFSGAAAALAEAQKGGAPQEELQAYYAQLGLTAYDHGRMELALDAFHQLRDLNPEAIEGWFNCGLVYQKMGHFEEALASYQNAVRIAPGNAKTWCNLSSIWFERGDFAEAEKARAALDRNQTRLRARLGQPRLRAQLDESSDRRGGSVSAGHPHPARASFRLV